MHFLSQQEPTRVVDQSSFSRNVLCQAALAFGKGQQIFVLPLGNHCFVTVVFTIEMVSRSWGALQGMMPAKKH
jgi:hypothetical protein